MMTDTPRRGGMPNSTARYTDEEILSAREQHGLRRGARVLGISPQALLRRLDRIACGKSAPELVLKGTSILTDKNGELVERWDKTRMRGRSDADVQHLPDPKLITKVSTLYDQEGRVTQQWVAERPDDLRRAELWREAAEAFAAQLPRVPLIELSPSPHLTDLLTVYPIGDHHMG